MTAVDRKLLIHEEKPRNWLGESGLVSQQPMQIMDLLKPE